LRIDEARLLRSKEGDEVFVRATIKGLARSKNCQLLDTKARSTLREAIESGDPSDAAALSVSQWADTHRTQKLSGGNTLAISFGEDPTQSDGASCIPVHHVNVRHRDGAQCPVVRGDEPLRCGYL
jgi:hypothetical protein